MKWEFLWDEILGKWMRWEIKVDLRKDEEDRDRDRGRDEEEGTREWGESHGVQSAVDRISQ